MKINTSLPVMVLAALVAGCSDVGTKRRLTDADLQSYVIGRWHIEETGLQKGMVVFYSDGRVQFQWPVPGTDQPGRVDLYWWVSDRHLLITKVPGTLPNQSDGYWMPRHIAKHKMVFGHIGGDMDVDTLTR